MRLLADCGNSHLKIAVAQGLAVTGVQVDDVAEALLHTAVTGDELVVLPGNRERTEVLVARWAARGPLRILGRELPVPDLGQYPTCGLDRLCAGVAAARLLPLGGTGLVVVDAGTAVTCTAWRLQPRLAFAGGLILPGRRACAVGLHQAAPALPLVEVMDGLDPTAAQHSTGGAIAAALRIGHPAMVAACARRLASETGQILLMASGGGWNADLAAALPEARHLPHLALRGLAILAEGSQP